MLKQSYGAATGGIPQNRSRQEMWIQDGEFRINKELLNWLLEWIS
jgi:hypothetical protein